MEARKLRNVVVNQKKTVRGKNFEKEPINAYCTLNLGSQSSRTKTLYANNVPRWYSEHEL